MHLRILSVIILSWSVAAGQSFRSQLLDDKVEIGYGLAIGDVDGDAKPDILLADKKQFVWYRNGDWKRFVLTENLTTSDNVCLAARDIDGDGKVEIAVGAQWNPGETADTSRSGAVFYLVRPSDPTGLWQPVKLHHEPTVHRMRWVNAGGGRFQLVVVPLHGRGNKNGTGKGVRIYAYERPSNLAKPWSLQLVDSTLHMTHNFDVVPAGQRERLYIGGREGVKVFDYNGSQWTPVRNVWAVQQESFGEVRVAHGGTVVTGIQPMHGHQLTVYANGQSKVVITDRFNQGHALAAGRITEAKGLQVVAGWREPDADGKVGIRLFTSEDDQYRKWSSVWIDENGMACEDLQVADLDGDGKLEIIAAGRATRNLKIYWQR